MQVVVVAGAPIAPSHLVEAALADADLLIAADGGASRLIERGRRPQIVVGDMDSIPAQVREELQAAGSEVVWHPSAKDKTDSHLALELSFARGADQVTMLGLFGGERLDHSFANTLLIGGEDFRARNIRILDGFNEGWICRGEAYITGRPGDYVTLLALSAEVTGIRTRGLRYEVPGGRLTLGDSLGVSNELVADNATIERDEGLLMILHQHRA